MPNSTSSGPITLMENGNYWSETENRPSSHAGVQESDRDDPPLIGRYRVIRRLGQGGFGRVYLARDDDLDRSVAIKVPNPGRIVGPGDVEAYLAEARALAKLDHPHVVPVYDVGRTADGHCFVVSRFVDGSDLAERIRQGRPSFRESAALVAVVAEALHHAHTRGLVHRDIKPANILIDTLNEPWVADFGLALKDEDYGKGARLAGTPAYMSPEQARGEGHRVDGRSDIFSLGVVLYELLTGRKPFRGDTRAEVMDQIATGDPRPLRQIDDTIPRELERICQKALAKRASERYSTGRDFAEDLRHFLQTQVAPVPVSPSAPASVPPATAPAPVTPTPISTQDATPVSATPGRSDSDGRAIKIVPKGLRSFDRNDADFFLELLPGPRDREGLPESLRFWKSRIESTDPDATFKVGLIYGPSGCGKSSLVKAGLLPRLHRDVLPVYVEATPEETEARLLRGIRKVCTELGTGMDLVDSLAALRRGRVLRSGQKVLLVLDQFEQWLFARRSDPNPELVTALRQCDGEHVQAVVMVRDDFWMAATRFMRDLEVRIVEGENSAAVDLFDLLHARRVLGAFGRAYGVLPERSSELTPDQKAFLEQSVAGLAHDGKIISVRLALFAEMVKGKPWSTATLKDVGGARGIGVTFLDETFSAATAPPEHRLHQRAAQAVLKALLPGTGTDIKGQMRSEADLRDASGYADRPRDFEDLIVILDRELRLITPTDPEGSVNESQSGSGDGQRFYQLTHDYLVPSLREWLTRKQRESRRGRAELRLAERAAIWEARPENRHLPSVLEWFSIRALTRSKDWTGPQRKMMRRAGLAHGLRALAVLIGVVGLMFAALEAWNRVAASHLVKQLLTADTAQVPALMRDIAKQRRWTDPELRRIVAESSDPRAKRHADLALMPPDSMWELLEGANPGDPRLLPTAGALALYDPGDRRWDALGDKVAPALVRVSPAQFGSWMAILRPVLGKFSGSFASIILNKDRTETERALAATILADHAQDRPEWLAGLLLDADPKGFVSLFPANPKQPDKMASVFREALDQKPPRSGPDPVLEEVSEVEKDQRAQRQARAAVGLIRLDKAEEVREHLQHSPDPRLRSFIINGWRPLHADPSFIIEEIQHINDSIRPGRLGPRATMEDILFDPETSRRRALILALGTYPLDELPMGQKESLTKELIELHRTDPDAGIHGAAEWTLRKWGRGEELKRLDAVPRTPEDRGGNRWFVNRHGQTFAVIEGPVEFLGGSPATEPDRVAKSEAPRRIEIPRRFAIATEEVTVRQFQEFLKAHKQSKDWEVPQSDLDRETSPPDGPWIAATWYAAAAYCNWLSQREGLTEDQWCYVPGKDGKYEEGMTIPADALQRTGYRLPTEAEWEYACRAGAVTSRYYGQSTELLEKYAWYLPNSRGRARTGGTLLPNDLGLFDMLGNVYEWCQDRNGAVRPSERETDIDTSTTKEVVTDRSDRTRPERMIRGGFFYSQPADVRAAKRDADVPSQQSTYYGLRLARTLGRPH